MNARKLLSVGQVLRKKTCKHRRNIDYQVKLDGLPVSGCTAMEYSVHKCKKKVEVHGEMTFVFPDTPPPHVFDDEHTLSLDFMTETGRKYGNIIISGVEFTGMYGETSVDTPVTSHTFTFKAKQLIWNEVPTQPPGQCTE